MRVALLGIAARAARFLAGGGRPGADDVSDAVRRAQLYIRESFTQRISIADVAEAAHLSPNYLSTVFREATGKTVLEFVHELKLAEAKARLCETGDPVKTIAHGLGFDSSHYFSRFFRHATGMTPSEFRDGMK
jgi:two-component system response regulator YesN